MPYQQTNALCAVCHVTLRSLPTRALSKCQVHRAGAEGQWSDPLTLFGQARSQGQWLLRERAGACHQGWTACPPAPARAGVLLEVRRSQRHRNSAASAARGGDGRSPDAPAAACHTYQTEVCKNHALRLLLSSHLWLPSVSSTPSSCRCLL